MLYRIKKEDTQGTFLLIEMEIAPGLGGDVDMEIDKDGKTGRMYLKELKHEGPIMIYVDDKTPYGKR